MFDLGSVIAHFKADTTDFEKSVGKMQSKTKGFAEKSFFASHKVAIGISAMTTAVVAFGVKSVKAFNEADKKTTALTRLILNQRGATIKNVEALKDQAGQLSRNTAIDKTAIIAAQAKLATFDLQSDAIKKLIPSLLDMQAGEEQGIPTTESLVGAANSLGKALQGNTELFTKQGFIITEHQKEILKTGTETERLAVINEVLGKTYKDAAVAMGDTFSGRLQKLRNFLGDFMETVGLLIANFLSPLVKNFLDWVDAVGGVDGVIRVLSDRLSVFVPIIDFTKESIKKLVAWILTFKDLINENVDSVKNLKDSLDGLISALGGFEKDGGDSAAFFKIVGAVIWAAGKATSYLNNQLAAAIDLLTGLINKFKELKKKREESKENQGLFGKIVDIGSNIGSLGFGSLLDSMMKATGGPVQSGSSYIVGEKGPELFTPNSSGTITPNDKMAGSYHVTNNVQLNTEAAVYSFMERQKKDTIAAKFGLSIA